MEYEEIAPPPSLAGIVRCFWTLRGDAPAASAPPAEPAFPDGSPELIFNFAAPFEHLPTPGHAVRQPAAFLVGQITRPMYVRPTGAMDLLAARFESHGAALLHRPMRALTERWIALERLRGKPLTDVSGLADLVDGLERLVRERPLDARVATCVHAIRVSHGALPLKGLLDEAGLTARSLQRLFADQVGIGPKLLARIARFQRIFATFRAEPASLSRVALECGYYDQSHLIRDFREFAGDAPAQLLAATPAFTALFTA